MMITPTRRIEEPTYLTVDECIDIFEERIYGWHLHVAEQMVKPIMQENGEVVDRTIPHSEYAVLQIIMSYFETVAKYYDGFAREGDSGVYFRRGIRMCFGDESIPKGEGVDNMLNALYNRARNALYHSTSAVGIGFANQPWVIIGMVEGRNEIILNLDSVITMLIQHLRSYCNCLRNAEETELRDKFMRRFEFDMKAPEPVTFT